MRSMLILKASPESEAAVMLAGEELQASSKGAKVKFGPTRKPTVVDGPFAETKELIAGLRLESADFGPEVAAREDALRAEIEKRKTR
ncbi:MAG: hypothetical protein HY820_13335 [Acidobacteria bacterium]|nr:hypothetical protein [Acidobacteriota bacterium]